MAKKLYLKRIYEPACPGDGLRVLVDRLWPRGVRKEKAKIDVWLKQIAPSPDLRQWFHHEPEKFAGFKAAYQKQLAEDGIHQEAVRQVTEWLDAQPVTLVYAAKEETFNHAVILRQFILCSAAASTGKKPGSPG